MANSIPVRVESRSTFKMQIESPRLHAEVTLHVLWTNGQAEAKRMPLHEALTWAAAWAMDARAITIYREPHPGV